MQRNHATFENTMQYDDEWRKCPGYMSRRKCPTPSYTRWHIKWHRHTLR